MNKPCFSSPWEGSARVAPPVVRAGVFLVAFALSGAAAATPLRPFPQHTSYAAGTIRPAHLSQAQQDDDVRAYYDAWKADFLIAAGTDGAGQPLFRISLGSAAPDVTVSEGQGYGMMIVAHLAGYDPDAQQIFDGLWRFSREHPSDIDGRLMAWRVPPDPAGNDSAFDGDADIAYGLLLAAAQWGNEGPIDYATDAATVLAGLLESTIGPESDLPLLGDWVDPDGSRYSQWTTRSSDFMPGHFRAFARASSETRWSQVIAAVQASVTQLQAKQSRQSGLLPDFLRLAGRRTRTAKPAPPYFLEGPFDGAFYYNAGRAPWRLGVDALISGDPVSAAQVQKMSRFAATTAGGDPLALRAGYRLNGKPLPETDYFTIFFAAPLGVAAMADPAAGAWLEAIYDQVRTRHEDYFEDSIALLSLLVLTGNWFDPTLPQ